MFEMWEKCWIEQFQSFTRNLLGNHLSLIAECVTWGTFVPFYSAVYIKERDLSYIGINCHISIFSIRIVKRMPGQIFLTNDTTCVPVNFPQITRLTFWWFCGQRQFRWKHSWKVGFCRNTFSPNFLQSTAKTIVFQYFLLKWHFVYSFMSDLESVPTF